MIQLVNHASNFRNYIGVYLKKERRTLTILWWLATFARIGTILAAAFLIWVVYKSLHGVKCLDGI